MTIFSSTSLASARQTALSQHGVTADPPDASATNPAYAGPTSPQSAISASPRAHLSAAARSVLDQRARTVGWPDLEALIRATAAMPAPYVGRLLDRAVATVKLYRRRFKVSGEVHDREVQRLHEKARAAGFATLGALIASTSRLPLSEVAALIGTDDSVAWHWRACHEITAHAPERPAGTRAGTGHGGLDTLPVTMQQRRDDGCLLCRACRTWQPALARHLRDAHGISVTDYRRRYLPAVDADPGTVLGGRS